MYKNNKRFNNEKKELSQDERNQKFEKMMEKWKKISKENINESTKEHTKSDGKKKKKVSAERRKQNTRKKSY